MSKESVVIAPSGTLDRSRVPALLKQLPRKGEPDSIDLSDLDELDPAGIVCIRKLLHDYPTLADTAFSSLPERLQEIYSAFSNDNLPLSSPPKPPSLLEHIGGSVVKRHHELRSFLQLAADSAFFSVKGVFSAKGRRAGSVIQHCFTMGVEAVGIIALLSTILGFILALQAAIQLQQFGAGMMVANLIALSLIHEMGPIMTSIIIAGRTGSSIASEIASMKVTEELDALKMMGMHPIRYTMVPKMLAITLVIPLLLTLSIVTGILGGTVVGTIYLDINPITYLEQSASVVVLRDLVRSYSKTVVFAWVIVLIGGHYGFQVRGGAEEVGRATTKSVVAAIFAILVLDALFSLTLLIG
ncbi:MlaE family ABC transporter permease [Spirochaeta dissipatitropha]